MRHATKVISMLHAGFIARALAAHCQERFPIVRINRSRSTSSVYVVAGFPSAAGGMTTEIELRASNHPAAGRWQRRPGKDVLVNRPRHDVAAQIDRAIAAMDRALAEALKSGEFVIQKRESK